MTRLSDEELCQVRTLIPAECVGLLHYVDSMAAELRALRLTAEEREALVWASEAINAEDARHHGANVSTECNRALRVLARLAGKETT